MGMVNPTQPWPREREVFTVDVGHMTPTEQRRVIEAWKAKIRTFPVVDKPGLTIKVK